MSRRRTGRPGTRVVTRDLDSGVQRGSFFAAAQSDFWPAAFAVGVSHAASFKTDPLGFGLGSGGGKVLTFYGIDGTVGVEYRA